MITIVSTQYQLYEMSRTAAGAGVKMKPANGEGPVMYLSQVGSKGNLELKLMDSAPLVSLPIGAVIQLEISVVTPPQA